MEEISTEKLMELIDMDIALRDDLPSCPVVCCFIEPKESFLVRAIKYLKKLVKKV